jgi:hypothetical protein
LSHYLAMFVVSINYTDFQRTIPVESYFFVRAGVVKLHSNNVFAGRNE